MRALMCNKWRVIVGVLMDEVPMTLVVEVLSMQPSILTLSDSPTLPRHPELTNFRSSLSYLRAMYTA